MIHRFYPTYDGPIEYRALPQVANSDLKEIMSRHYGKPKLDNLEEIFDFGSLFDALFLEPHKANMDHPKIQHAMAMKKVLFRQNMILQIFNLPDIRRQHEFYRMNVFGLVSGKCKCDGDSKIANLVFELKGLGVTTDKQFREAIDHLDYDQACAWYLEVTKRKHYLIAAASKKVDRAFLRYVDRNHEIYKNGVVKIKESTKIWKQYGFV